MPDIKTNRNAAIMLEEETNKIFGIGLLKTGTTCLYVALQLLGYRSGTYRHMRALGLREWFSSDFRKDFLRDYDAVTDLPMGSFYPQLFHRYPNSKFILTTRETSAWLESCRRQLSRPPEDEFSRMKRLVTYGCEVFNADRFRFVSEAHERNVR